MVTVNNVPTTTRVPFVYVNINNEQAVSGPALMSFKNLVIGQRLPAGETAALTPVRITSAAVAKEAFGEGSMLARTLEAQLKGNASTETYAIALDDVDAGVASTGSLTVSGTVASGTIKLYIAGQRVQVGVASTDTLAAIATQIAAAITAMASLPVTAAVNGSDDTVVDLTAKHKGEVANTLDIRHSYYTGEALPSGLTLTIDALSGGTANPDLADVIAVLGDEQYHVITFPYTDASNLSSLETELDRRWGPMAQIDGQAITASTGTHSELGTLGDSRNNKHIGIMPATGIPEPVYEVAAAVAAQVSYYGAQDPGRPFKTLELIGISAPDITDRFSAAERNLLLNDGISTFTVDAGGKVRIERMISTYKTSPSGAEDISYLDFNTLMILSYLRYDFRNYILRKYPRHKLGNDSTKYGSNQPILTPKIGKGEAINRFRVWEKLALVEGFEQFSSQLVVERNDTDPNRMDWYLPVDIINQFRVGGVEFGFIL